MNILEIIGVLFGALGVWLLSRQSMANWAVSMVSIFIYIFIFYRAKLYGDMVLQFFYLAMSIYGWFLWSGKFSKQEVQITKLDVKKIPLYLFAATISVFVVYFILSKTDTDVAFFDAFTTVLSITATFMQAKKIMENWLIWIFVDAIYIFIYIYKDLYMTSLLYFAFTILAGYGYYQWRKEWRLLIL